MAFDTVQILLRLKISNTVFYLDSMNQIIINVFNDDAEYIFVAVIIAIYKKSNEASLSCIAKYKITDYLENAT